MAINYNDPAFQRILLRKNAMKPWGGTMGYAKEASDWASAQTKSQLEFGQLGLLSRMNQAKIEQMKFDQAMAGKRLDLSGRYVGIDEQRLGLKGKYLDIDEKRLGLQDKYIGIGEKELGLKTQQMGLAAQAQQQRFGQDQWRYNAKMKALSDAEDELNLSTWLGLGTSAYAGYEAYERKKTQEASAKKWDEFIERNRRLMK
jgi:hypothetical protein